MSQTFSLTLTGNFLPGIEPATATQLLAQLLKLNDQKTADLLAKAPTVIKKELPHAQLEQYIGLFNKVGVEVRAELNLPNPNSTTQPASSVAVNLQQPVASVELMSCPSCGYQQPKRTLCVACGCDMPRRLAAQQQEVLEKNQAIIDARRELRNQPFMPASEARESILNRVGPLKLGLFALMLVAGGWWFFVGGKQISEEQVHQFYADYEAATLSRNPEKLCAFLAEDFKSSAQISLGGLASAEGEGNKAETCSGMKELYTTFETLGEKMGGILQLDSSYEIHSIKIAADKKSAEVEISSSLDVAGSIMNIKSKTTDTLIRRNGKVLLLRSKGQGSIGAGG
ncbi:MULTISPECIES: hypothetical protein [Deefgea]|uniref:Uncharacterized protein n=1 Tax=Deefgea chitinilytica TaxID=570276 RepID=A0ABS2CDA7_9NEIS|nr:MULTISPECIES: hypothetical protein [Deefgea]MBM5572131.1 hypothetical protein [Deefgea chitinilytica]MBM9889366.1 hypothetical protein [Deefgea sp. CFH1-16]